jgi:hypothetical protein
VNWTVNDGSSSFATSSQIAIERPPVVTASNEALNTNYMLVAASSLSFSAFDADNDAITTYGFKDTGAGHFVLNGVAQTNNVEIDVAGRCGSRLREQQTLASSKDTSIPAQYSTPSTISGRCGVDSRQQLLHHVWGTSPLARNEAPIIACSLALTSEGMRVMLIKIF